MKPYLQKYKGPASKHTCPNCGAKKRFTLYVDGDTHLPIHPSVGICDRVNKCGYHYPPRMYFADNPGNRKENYQSYKPYNPPDIETPVDYISYNYVIKSKSTESNFIDFLKRRFPADRIRQVSDEYLLGATKSRDVIFWQIDFTGKVRTGKIMKYDPLIGKRIHNQNGAIDWVHNKLKHQGKISQNFNLAQCLFGEHLLKRYPEKVVAIVESEKTAVLTSVLYPEYIWLSTGTLNGLTLDKCFVLENRIVIIFPDLGKAHAIWKEKADEISKFIHWKVSVSELLPKIASQDADNEGLDLADFLLN